jgi:formylglycine-generating enzyme required for sulfatase activity
MRRLSVAALGLTMTLVALGGVFLRSPTVAPPETLRIPAGMQKYRPAGEFRQGTRIVDSPMRRQHVPALDIMKYHVTEADYARCVADGACASAPVAGGKAPNPAQAQTHLNHADATAYAGWLSDRTGVRWRLPTDAEWLRAAGDRGVDEALGDAANGADPSRRWITAYRREVALRGDADLLPHAIGHFGVNDHGVADIAGNIWEWTDTCFRNGTLTADGRAVATGSDYCGVRAVQGKHRAFVIDFVRDARAGGCATGVPPDYLGLRLVRG